jgi:hypothetical protein
MNDERASQTPSHQTCQDPDNLTLDKLTQALASFAE